LVALKESDFDFSTGSLKIDRAEQRYKDEKSHSVYVIGNPKNDASRTTIIIPEIAMSYAKRIIDDNHLHGYTSWFLQGPEGRYHTYDMDHAIRRLCRLAGIPVRSMHKCRKSTASILIDDVRANESQVKYYMRHSLYETTQKAYHFSRSGEKGKQDDANRLNRVLMRIS